MTVDRKLPRYCGLQKDLKMESDGAFFRVTFKSNDRFDGTGFYASYQFTPVADAVTITRRRSSSPASSSPCKINWTFSRRLMGMNRWQSNFHLFDYFQIQLDVSCCSICSHTWSRRHISSLLMDGSRSDVIATISTTFLANGLKFRNLGKWAIRNVCGKVLGGVLCEKGNVQEI